VRALRSGAADGRYGTISTQPRITSAVTAFSSSGCSERKWSLVNATTSSSDDPRATYPHSQVTWLAISNPSGMAECGGRWLSQYWR
jgi:hypothetical protein